MVYGDFGLQCSFAAGQRPAGRGLLAASGTELRRIRMFDGRTHRRFRRLVPVRTALSVKVAVSRSVVVAGGIAGKPCRIMAQAPGQSLLSSAEPEAAASARRSQ